MSAEKQVSIMSIEKDCDVVSGAIDFPGDVHIGGSVRENTQLKAGGRIIVAGAIEAATVEAGGELRVHGGIVGKDRGRCSTASNLSCRFASGAYLAAGGDVHVEASILQCHLSCGGALKVQAGTISGGEVSANGGIVCKLLGSATGIPTFVEAGVDRRFLSVFKSTLQQAELDRKRIHTIRTTVAPLLQQQKNLTAKQKERATELLYEADELSHTHSRKLDELRELWLSSIAAASSQIIVTEVLHAGTTIRFAGLETVIHTDIKGPLTLTTRKLALATEIVIIDGISGVVSALTTSRVDDAALHAAHALLSKSESATTSASAVTVPAAA